MTIPALTKVVHIGTGETMDAVIETREWGNRVWRPGRLKRDGGFPGNRRPDGHMLGKQYGALSDWAIYDVKREAKAGDFRGHIQDLRREIEQAQARLLALYEEER